jgi:hypothetical protein
MSKEEQHGTRMIGLQGSILALGQFYLNYSHLIISRLVLPLQFSGLSHSLSIFLSNESSGYWHLPCIFSLLLLFRSLPLENN